MGTINLGKVVGPPGPMGPEGPQGPEGPSGGVFSVNQKTGDVVLNAEDIGALPIEGGTVTGDVSVEGKLEVKGDAAFAKPLSVAIPKGIIAGINMYKEYAGVKRRLMLGLENAESNVALGVLDENGRALNAIYLGEKGTFLQKPIGIGGGGTGAGTSVDARRNLGFGKLLWSGSWSSGNITVPELNDYVLFLIRPYGTACNIVAAKIDGNIRGVGVHGYDNQQTLYSFLSTVSGNTLTSIHSFSMQHNVSSTHGAKVGVGIYEIYGIC